MTVQALDAGGEVLGSQLQRVPIHGGRNDIKLAVCEGTVKIQLGEYPNEGENAVDRIQFVFRYPDDPTAAPVPVELAIADVTQWSDSFWAGRLNIEATALNAAGQVVARATRDAEVECDISPIGLCFRWVELQAAAVPSNVASVRVSSDIVSALGPFVVQPGAATEVYGFGVGDVVHFTAEGLDASGRAVCSQDQVVTVACGENTVALDLTGYGITATAAPTRIAADGQETSAITATLRFWRAGDTVTPSGDPVVGKSVQFSTTLGTLSGTNPAVSDASGQVSIQLTGSEPGPAKVVAYSESDHREGSVTVAIGDTDSDLTLRANFYRPSDQGTGPFVEAWVEHNGQTPAPGLPVRFKVSDGDLTLEDPVDAVTDASGTVAVYIRNASVGMGLIEVTVPGTGLVKHCLAYWGGSIRVSPPSVWLEIDKGQVLMSASVSPDPASLGLPARFDWDSNPVKYRKTRGGTAEVGGYATFEPIPNTNTAKLSRGSEPDTAVRFAASPAYLVDGEWQSLGDYPLRSGSACLVEFYQVGATISITIDSAEGTLTNAPDVHWASVRAYFVISASAEGNIRFLVHNPADNGGAFAWNADGFNGTAGWCTAGNILSVDQADHQDTQAPGTWITQTLQDFQDRYGQLSITMSDVPDPVGGPSVPVCVPPP